MQISQQQTFHDTETKSQCYQEDFLANHSHSLESEKERQMTVTFGQECWRLYEDSTTLGYWRKCYRNRLNGTPR
jgi:hypothetical protein